MNGMMRVLSEHAELATIQVRYDGGVVQEIADLCFTLIAGEDCCSSEDIIMGKLEDDLSKGGPILREVNTARTSSASRLVIS
jgi:hypothetical protein